VNECGGAWKWKSGKNYEREMSFWAPDRKRVF